MWSVRSSLRPGGHLYLDNDHVESDLDPRWLESGVQVGRCADGTMVRGSTETIWIDAPGRLVGFRRTVEITRPDGNSYGCEWSEEKHPPSILEMRTWLERHGFEIVAVWGDRMRSPYTDHSERAIFSARRSDGSSSAIAADVHVVHRRTAR